MLPNSLLSKFTRNLIQDLEALRRGDISLPEARVRAQLAREVLRSIHIQLQGSKLLSSHATEIEQQIEDK